MSSPSIYSSVLQRLIRKTRKGSCRQRVGAVVLDTHGKPLAFATNRKRFVRTGGGVHAELAALRKAPKGKRLLLVRVGRGGVLYPIHPCGSCRKVLAKLEIRVEGIW